jgi:hypothetical protein
VPAPRLLGLTVTDKGKGVASPLGPPLALTPSQEIDGELCSTATATTITEDGELVTLIGSEVGVPLICAMNASDGWSTLRVCA